MTALPTSIGAAGGKAFVPARLAARFGTACAAGTTVDLQAVVMLADISNFTSAAERAPSAERLVDLLQAFLEPMIDAVHAFDGEVASIRGDSLLAWWPVDADDGGRDATAVALRCAAALHAASARLPLAASEQLCVHVGLSIGKLLASAAGGLDGRFELVCGGPAVQEACIALNQAAAGSTVVSAPLWLRRPDGVDGVRTVGGYVGLTRMPAPGTVTRRSVGRAADASSAFLPQIVTRLDPADPLALLPSIRTVTALFCRVHDLDPDPVQAMATMHPLVLHAQRVALRHQGCVDRINVDERGVFLILFFGLPGTRGWRRDGPAVDAAVALRDALAATGLRCAIGLATGESRCGPVGSADRMHYSCHGVAPNVAARYMEFINEGIACDDATACAANDRHDFLHQQPATLKGLPANSSFNRLTGSQPHGPPALALYGREDSLSVLLRLALRASVERRRISVTLVGPPAIGKSALAVELARRAAAIDLAVVTLDGTAAEASPAAQPLVPHSGVLEVHVMRRDEHAPALVNGAERIVLGALPLAAVGEILRNAVGGARPREAAVRRLHERSAGHPLIVAALMDAVREKHGDAWLAEADSDVLPSQVQQACTLLIDALPAPARHTLLLLACADRACSVDDLERLSPWPLERSWLEKGCAALAEVKLLTRDGNGATVELGAPLLALTGRRLLCEPQRRAVHARIIGQSWPSGSALAAMDAAQRAHHHELAQQPQEAVDCLNAAAKCAMAAGRYDIAQRRLQALLRIAAVLQPSAAAHAEWLAQLSRCEVALGQLAHGEQSARKALDLLRLPLPDTQRGWLMLAARGLARRFVPGVRASTAPRDAVVQAVVNAINAFTVTSYFSAAPLPLLASSLLAVNEAQRAGVPVIAARSAGVIGYLCGLARLHGLAGRWFERTEAACRAAGDDVGQHSVLGGRVMYRIGCAHWDDARWSVGRALALCRQAGEPDDVETALTLSALLEHYAGDFARSLEDFERLHGSARGRGNQQHAAWGAYGMAQNLIVLGRAAEALPLLLEASELLLQVDDRHSDLICSGLLSLAHLHLGDYTRARQAALRALSIAERIAPNNFGSFVGYHAPATTLLALWGRAQRFAPQQVAEIETATTAALRHLARYARLFPVALPRMRMLGGWVALRRGSPAQARRLWERGLALAVHDRLPYDEALLHWSLYQAAMSPEAAAEHQRESQRLLEHCRAVTLLVEFGRSETTLSNLPYLVTP